MAKFTVSFEEFFLNLIFSVQRVYKAGLCSPQLSSVFQVLMKMKDITLVCHL